jgi:hypothetical protein
MYLRTGIGWIDIEYYSLIVIREEVIFRFLPISLACYHNWWGVVMTTICWATLHLVGFRWPMFLSTLVLGIGLGWLFIWLPNPYGLLACILIHLGIGAGGYKLGIIEKWIKIPPVYYTRLKK